MHISKDKCNIKLRKLDSRARCPGFNSAMSCMTLDKLFNGYVFSSVKQNNNTSWNWQQSNDLFKMLRREPPTWKGIWTVKIDITVNEVHPCLCEFYLWGTWGWGGAMTEPDGLHVLVDASCSTVAVCEGASSFLFVRCKKQKGWVCYKRGSALPFVDEHIYGKLDALGCQFFSIVC